MADNRGAQALRTFLSGQKQVDLSKKTGISQSHISRLASAENVPKMRDQALALHEACGIDPEWWDEPAAREIDHSEPPTGTG